MHEHDHDHDHDHAPVTNDKPPTPPTRRERLYIVACLAGENSKRDRRMYWSGPNLHRLASTKYKLEESEEECVFASRIIEHASIFNFWEAERIARYLEKETRDWIGWGDWWVVPYETERRAFYDAAKEKRERLRSQQEAKAREKMARAEAEEKEYQRAHAKDSVPLPYKVINPWAESTRSARYVGPFAYKYVLATFPTNPSEMQGMREAYTPEYLESWIAPSPPKLTTLPGNALTYFTLSSAWMDTVKIMEGHSNNTPLLVPVRLADAVEHYTKHLINGGS